MAADRELHLAEVALRTFARSATGPSDRPHLLSVLLAEYDRRQRRIDAALALLDPTQIHSIGGPLADQIRQALTGDTA